MSEQQTGITPDDILQIQRTAFRDVILKPTIELAERSMSIIEPLTLIEGFELSVNQKRTIIVYRELIQLRGDVDNIPITETYERFRKIIKRNPATKRKVYRSNVRTWWKAIFRRMCGTGRNPDGKKDQMG